MWCTGSELFPYVQRLFFQFAFFRQYGVYYSGLSSPHSFIPSSIVSSLMPKIHQSYLVSLSFYVLRIRTTLISCIWYFFFYVPYLKIFSDTFIFYPIHPCNTCRPFQHLHLIYVDSLLYLRVDGPALSFTERVNSSYGSFLKFPFKSFGNSFMACIFCAFPPGQPSNVNLLYFR